MRVLCSILAISLFSLLHVTAIGQTTTYENPEDGNEYTAEWETYEPETPRDDPDSRVSIETVVLLTSQDDLAKRVSVESLGTYIEQLEADLLELATISSDHGRVWLQVDIEKDEPPVHQLAYDGSISTELLQAYFEKISKSENGLAVFGPVSLELVMVVRDHSQRSNGETAD